MANIVFIIFYRFSWCLLCVFLKLKVNGDWLTAIFAVVSVLFWIQIPMQLISRMHCSASIQMSMSNVWWGGGPRVTWNVHLHISDLNSEFLWISGHLDITPAQENKFLLRTSMQRWHIVYNILSDFFNALYCDILFLWLGWSISKVTTLFCDLMLGIRISQTIHGSMLFLWSMLSLP